MENYKKPSLRVTSNRFALHIGTNDLTSSTLSPEIANSIINLAYQLKTESHDVSVSAIILKNCVKKERLLN